MAKKCLILFLFILVSGCSKTKEEVAPKISSTGKLTCTYKLEKTAEKTLYTSEYVYNYDDNGFLTDVIDNEVIEFNDTSDEIKKTYQELVDITLKEYSSIDGVHAEKKLDDNKYVIKIVMDVDKMDSKIKEDYLVSYDRINTYKIFTDMKYTCQ